MLLFFALIVQSVLGISLPTTNEWVAGNITAKEAVKMMGRGINFGNSWDGAPNGVTNFADMQKIIDNTKSHGFGHVRFTVTWSDGDNPQPSGSAGGNLANLKQAVNYALSKDLFVVLNWHWNHPSGGNLGGFVSGWRTIAGRSDYFSESSVPSRKLIFEVLNEPNYNSGGGGESVTRQVNKAGYDAIRSVDNSRIVLVMPDNQGNWGNLDSVYPSNNPSLLPGGGKDPYLGVNVHSYDPWAFAGQGSEGAYPGCNFYTNIADTLGHWSDATGVAVTVNEFGLSNQPRDSQNDYCYLSLMANLLVQKSIAPAVWNDYGGFGIINRNGDFTNGDGGVVLGGCRGCGCGC